jgi:MFS family permease
MWLAATAALTGIGMGLGMPAANNASMQLAPDQIAGISGLRGMFRQCGSITSISITTAILARSGDPGIAQAHVLVVFAVIIAFIVPLIFLVPDHRGGW